MDNDRNYIEQNILATNQLRDLVNRLSEKELSLPMGEHWTISIALAHIAFWDQRVIHVIELAERTKVLSAPFIDDQINDILLPFLRAIPPREAARIALMTAETLDQKIEHCAPALADEMLALNNRLVMRAPHRTEHLNKVELVLRNG